MNLAALVFITSLSAAMLRGQSYVQNGDFDSQSLSPWTVVGESSMLGYKVDKGFWWLNKPSAGFKFTGLSQRLWLPEHDGLWMLSVETYGGPSACHYMRVSFDNKVLRNDCVGGDALRQWVFPLSAGAHRLEILATQLGMPEASFVRRAHLTKVAIPHATLNQYRGTQDELTIFARPWHAYFIVFSPRRLPSGVSIPGIEGLFWLFPEGPLLSFGPFLSPSTAVTRVPIGADAIQAARGTFLQVLSLDPVSLRARFGTRNWIPE